MSDGFDVDLDLTHWPLILAGLLAMLLLVYRGLWGPEGARLLVWARVAVVGLLLILLGEPILSLNYGATRHPLVTVLIDNSESLQIASGDRTRAEAVRAILEAPAWDRLRERARIRWFAFDVDAREIEDPQTLAFDGPGTDLATALQTVESETADEGLVGVVLISDGAHNLGVSPESVAGDLGMPVHTVVVGAEGVPTDLSITWWGTEPLGYVGQPLNLDVILRASGAVESRDAVEVWVDGNPVARKMVDIETGDHAVSLGVTPERPGLVEYEVRAPEVMEERELRNNRVVVRANILDARLRVLMVGPPSADLAYLRRTIEADSNFAVDFLPVVRHGLPTSLTRALAAVEERDVVVLHDVSLPLRGGVLGEYVRKGGGLLVVGGPASVLEEPGDLASVLPTGSGPYEARSFGVEVPTHAMSHPVARGGRDSAPDSDEWRTLPPLGGLNRLGQIRADARVLLQTTSTREPIAVVAPVAAGKVMVFAGRAFWRHGLMSLGYDRVSEAPASFWRAGVRWLSTREDISRLRVETDRTLYRSGEPIQFRAQLFDALLQPVDGARVEVRVDGDGARTATLRSIGGGRYDGRLRGLPQGSHAYSVVARRADDELGRKQGTLTVGRYSLEFENLGVDPARLAALSAGSGGQTVHQEQVGAALDAVVLSPQPYRVSMRKHAWGGTWPFWFAAAVLCAEWAWRRRRGMV